MTNKSQRTAKERFQVKCGMLTLHLDGDKPPIITAANDEFYSIVGYTKEEIAEIFENNLFNLVAEAEKQDILAYLHSCLLHEQSFSIKFNLRAKDNRLLPVLMAGHFMDKDTTWISIFQDNHLKNTDELTGLGTLSIFRQKALRILKKPQASKKYLVLSADLEKFKNANSFFGYEIGNRILVSFSRLISNMLLPGELVCRYYADRFLVFLSYESEESMAARLSSFEHSLEELQGSNQQSYSLLVSAGIYYIAEGETDIISIIDKANIARKTVKGSHQNSLAIYNLEISDRLAHESKIESGMVQALQEREFTVYLQPKVCLSDNKIIGAEALVRWQRPDGSVVMPNEFISIFERNGFIISLDFYVYDMVCAIMSDWKKRGITPVPVSVNVSPAHFKYSDFVARFNDLVDSYGIAHDLIELELTESLFLDDVQNVCAVMQQFRSLGYVLSIDDFGSGYSSLHVLKELPADILKLDREFFRADGNGTSDKREKTIVSYIIHMAKELDLKVISEGVETQQQQDFLQDSNCDMAQGFLFSKPMPAAEFEELLWKK